MSFGYSVGDAVLLTQIAWKTVQNARKACGEHDELTQEVLGLHVVLRRLELEISKPESLLNRSGDTYKEEVEIICRGCSKVLRVLDNILEKYNRLSEEERSWRKLWQKIRFGNGEIADLQDLRSKMVTNTSALSLTLHMASLGSLGRIEKQMKGDLHEIKIAIHGTAARLMTRNNNEGSVLTSYTNDDKSVWKEFRRDLCRDGFSSSDLKRHRTLIMAYITELGDRGLFDDVNSGDLSEDKNGGDRHEQSTADLSLGGKNAEYSSTDQPLSTSLNTPSVFCSDPVSQENKRLPSESGHADSASDTSRIVSVTDTGLGSPSEDTPKHCARSTHSEGISASEPSTADKELVERIDLQVEKRPSRLRAETINDDKSNSGVVAIGTFIESQVESVDLHAEDSALSQRIERDFPWTKDNERMRVLESQDSSKFPANSSNHSELQERPFYMVANRLLDRFTDRYTIALGSRRGAVRFHKVTERLDDFLRTAQIIMENIFRIVSQPGDPVSPNIINFGERGPHIMQTVKHRIGCLLADYCDELASLKDLFINVSIWTRRFDQHCGGIVFQCQDWLDHYNYNCLQMQRNTLLRELWAMPYCLDSVTSPMQDSYKCRSFFSGSSAPMENEGPTSQFLANEFRRLAEDKLLGRQPSMTPSYDLSGTLSQYWETKI